MTVVVATAGMLLSAGSADAAHTGGLVYPPGLLESLPDVSNNAGGVSGDSVACPSSHPHPTGGGVLIEGVDSLLGLEVHATSPTLLNDGWKIRANNSSGADAQMTIFAICATGQYLYPSVTKSVAAGHVRGAKVTCPAGTNVVGGGIIAVGGDHHVEVASSEPADGPDADHKPDDAWFGIANNGMARAIHMQVHAVCARRGRYTVVAGTRTLLPTDDIATSAVLCPAGTRVTGGGTAIEGASTDLEVHDGFPIDGSDTDTTRDDGWQGTAYNDGATSSAHMRVYAICKHV